MLQKVRQEFTAPDMGAEDGKEVCENLVEDNNNIPIQSDINVTVTRISDITESESIQELIPTPNTLPKYSNCEIDVLPCVDSSLLLKPKEAIPFCDYMIYWLKASRNSIAKDTYSGYQYTIEKRIYPYFAEKGYSLAEIEAQPFLIQAYYDYEVETYGISANTIVHRHANIRKALQDAFKIKLITSNPADCITKPLVEEFEATVYNEKELATLFTVFKGDPLELAVILASFYGLRRSEIIGLKWKNIDFECKTITIKHLKL